MILAWLKKRRRKRYASRDFPTEWERAMQQNVGHIQDLTGKELEALRRWMKIFIAEKYWEGCDGLTMTEEIQATIAAQAGFMIRGHGEQFFEQLKTILVFPHTLYRQDNTPKQGGVVSEGLSARIGEAWKAGPVCFVWPEVLESGRQSHSGRNVVFHEFAHVLDWEDQFLDGTPMLTSPNLFHRWEEVITVEYQAFVHAVETGQPTVIDPYGATNIGEFFAVSTEHFFEQPQLLANHHPKWYGLLREYYNLDTTTDVVP